MRIATPGCLISALFPLLALPGCREPDRPTFPDPAAGVFVDSDPRGAEILLDGEPTGAVTPDTLRNVAVTTHRVDVRMDSAGLQYSFGITFQASQEEVVDLEAPLLYRCGTSCIRGDYSPNDVLFWVSPVGVPFYSAVGADAAQWPAGSNNSYVATLMPVIAGNVAGDRVALGPYNVDYLAGRPAPEFATGEEFRLLQQTWILPPGGVQGFTTIRGVKVEEEIFASSAVPDVVVLRLTFRNITDTEVYRWADPGVPPGGLAYEDVYAGLALDGDVGAAGDDLVTYDPQLDLAFFYDANFSDQLFQPPWREAPGMVGMRVLEAPTGATVALNAWPIDLDWHAGTITRIGVAESSGWEWLSGTGPATPAIDQPGLRVGGVPQQPRDYRASATVGPISLAPGESVEMAIAVVFAAPVAGTFTSGDVVDPGDPSDSERMILQIAEDLRQRAIDAEGALDPPM